MDSNKKNITLDDLAEIVQAGFKTSKAELDGLTLAMQAGFKTAKDDNESLAAMVAQGFDAIDKKFDGVNQRMDKLENEMQGLRSSVNNYLELSDKRYLELKAREAVIVNWVKMIADKTGVQINLEDLGKAA